MENPLISIVIPVYNSINDFPKCIGSIIGQTYKNLQILIIDDGSTDGCSELIDKYAAQDSRIVAVHQENKGVSAARNRGIELAVGEYVHFPDSDDYLELDAYEYALSLFKMHECDLVAFEHYVTYLDHEDAHVMLDSSYGLKSCHEAHRVVCEGSPFACNKLYKNSLLHGLRFREDIFRGEDTLFVHMYLERVNTVWFDERPLYHYVQNNDSASRGAFRETQLSGLKLFQIYADLFKAKYPGLYNKIAISLTRLCISLYYDMFADRDDHRAGMKLAQRVFESHRKEILFESISAAERTKFLLFHLSPWAFCKLHKIIHRL